MMAALLKPELYSDDGGRVTLKGGRCSSCGYVFFPMQTRGCEACGAHDDALKSEDLGGEGRLVAAATVHVHAGKTREAPFVIGTVELDSGPRVRALLDGMPDAETRTGARVVATLVEAPGRDGGVARDLHFRAA